MKRLIITISFLLLNSIIAQEISVDTVWTKTFGGSGYDLGRSGQQTTDGGFIIIATTNSLDSSGSFGAEDVWLIKTDSNGDTSWTKTFGELGNGWISGYEYAEYVQQTTDGGYILTGATNSFGNGGLDVWLIKTTDNGSELWNQTFGGSGYDYAEHVQQTTDGGYIITGNTESFGNGGSDIWLIKTDSNGDSLWSQTYGGSSDEIGYSVQQTNDGGYIITGYTYTSGNNNDIWLIKTDSQGNEEWNNTFDYSGGDEIGYSVQQTNDGGYIITGHTDTFMNGNSNVWLVKTDSTGYQEWNSFLGGNKSRGNSVQQTADDGYIITGHTYTSENNNDIWLIKTDSLGQEEWNQTFGGIEGDGSKSVQLTDDGGYIVTGYTRSFGNGSADVWLLKVKASNIWHVATTGSDATGDGTEENPFATIQTAIDTAGESDTVLVSAGTYFENLIWPPMNGIKLIGSGEESCTIDGDSTGRVITFLDSLNGIIDTNTLITGFTIQNGYSDPDNSIETPGGGIYCSNSSPIFTDCTIKENFAYGDGGGIVLADSANAILLNVKIENNVAKGRQIPGFPPTRFQGKGGGLFIYNSDPIFTGVDIRDNYAGYNGAGVYILYSSPVFSDFTISGNGGSGYLQKGGGYLAKEHRMQYL